MKKLIFILVTGCLFACTTEREIQANLVDASLVKIDVIQRYPNTQLKMLTWRTMSNVFFVIYEPLSTEVALGSLRKAIVKK
jgi:hypothetical protein